jgi:hypothetical protein
MARPTVETGGQPRPLPSLRVPLLVVSVGLAITAAYHLLKSLGSARSAHRPTSAGA